MVALPEADIPVRDRAYDLDDVPRYWHGGRRAVTLFFNNLSTLFPLGERFFIKSVSRYRKRLQDPELQTRVRAFTGQEAMHTREHERYNAMLRRQGWDVDALERGIASLLGTPRLFRRRRDRFELATTAALEHWTALFARFALEDPAMFADAHPQMAALWRWHAVEECEHKAVAFDVYQATGGGYGMRVGALLVASALFWARVACQQRHMMAHDGLAQSPREWADVLRFLFVEQRIVQRLAPLWLAYLRPGFHPDDIDDSDLLAAWRAADAAPEASP